MKIEMPSTDQQTLDVVKSTESFTFDRDAYADDTPETLPDAPAPPVVKVDHVKPIAKPGVSESAPFGLNDDGTPFAPYGFTRRGNRVKTVPGRPRDDQQPAAGTESPLTGQSTVKPNATQPQTPKPDDSQQLNDALKDSQPKPTPAGEIPATASTSKPNYKVWINGSMFLVAMDFVFPGTIAFAFNYFSKTHRVKAEDLKFTDDERKDLEPLADEVVGELLNKMSPLEQFIIFTAILYGAKLTFAAKEKVKVTPSKSKEKVKVDEKK